jgi:hypothetical protein
MNAIVIEQLNLSDVCNEVVEVVGDLIMNNNELENEILGNFVHAIVATPLAGDQQIPVTQPPEEGSLAVAFDEKEMLGAAKLTALLFRYAMQIEDDLDHTDERISLFDMLMNWFQSNRDNNVVISFILLMSYLFLRNVTRAQLNNIATQVQLMMRKAGKAVQ